MLLYESRKGGRGTSSQVPLKTVGEMTLRSIRDNSNPYHVKRVLVDDHAARSRDSKAVEAASLSEETQFRAALLSAVARLDAAAVVVPLRKSKICMYQISAHSLSTRSESIDVT
jgi:hypothetical protein